MRHIDTDRLRTLADRRPGLVRRLLSDVLFQLPSLAIGGCVGGIVGIVFAAAEAPMLLALVVVAVIALVVGRIAESAWERAAGLTRVHPTRGEAEADEFEGQDEDVEHDDTDIDDIDSAEPARTADSPEVAAAR